jgi:tRNA G18 (ribose-2'-O)-methylase SpoU
MRFLILECQSPTCNLRFPWTERDPSVRFCPRCHGEVVAVEQGLLAAESERRERVTVPLELVVDNVRSAFNVGSILRSADAAGVRKVWLCGITPTPEHPRVARAALGAEQSVAWEYAPNSLTVARALLERGTVLWALEESEDAHSLFDAPRPAGTLTLVVGSEVAGVDPGLLRLCERVVCLPMRGVKRSLNVAVAAGVAMVVMGNSKVSRRRPFH